MAFQPTDDDSNLNPGQTDYDRKFNGLNEAEESGSAISANSAIDSQGDSINNLRNAEESPGGGWENNVSTNRKSSSKSKSKGRFSFLSKKGPLAFIITVVLGGSIGLTAFFSPGLLIVQFKEVLVNKFDAQLASSDIRTSKMLTSKVTSGSCGTIKIVCKYSSMSKAQIENFKKAGIEVVTEGEPNILGQKKPAKFIFEGTEIPANKFVGMMETDIKFRTAIKNAYNPKFAMLSDKVFDSVKTKLRITKEAPKYTGDTFDEKLANMSEDLAEKTKAKPTPHVTMNDKNPETGTFYTKEEMDLANSHIDVINDLIDEAGGDGASTSSKIVNGVKEADKWVGVSSYADIALESTNASCVIYRTYLAVGRAAKVVRITQLANYAMQFLNVADQIKAGVAKEEDVSFLGTILTKESLNDEGKALSATDGAGYKNAAFNDSVELPTNSVQYMAATGTTGALKNLKKEIPKPNATVCKILNSTAYTFASLLGGIVITLLAPEAKFATIAGKVKIFKTAITDSLKSPLTWATGLLSASEVLLPNLLKDIVAGSLVDANTIGSNAGDALTSGASVIMGTAAQKGGNAPLSAIQAVKYDSIKEDIATQYAEEDRLARSPLDMTNNNTFMGKIAAWIIPYTSKMSSLTGMFSSITSIVTKSFAFLTPQSANATTTNEADYVTCQDTDYRDLELATDIFCNVTYGMPGVEDSPDPITVAKALLNQPNPSYGLANLYEQEHTGETIPLINEDGTATEGQAYAKFVKNCINRNDPLVKSEDYSYANRDGRKLVESEIGNGSSECIFNDNDSTTRTQSWNNCTGPPPANEPFSSPGFGFVYLTNWIIETDIENASPNEDGCTPTKRYTRTFYYIGNEYLYLYFIDQRVESGMDGV